MNSHHVQQINVENFTRYFVNIGYPAFARNNINRESIITSPSKQDIINLQYTFRGIRKMLSLSTYSVSRGGRALIFHPLGEKVTHPVKKFFLQIWPNGLISNFKKLFKQHKYRIPAVVTIISNPNVKRKDIATELNTRAIASAFITNTNNLKQGLFNIPGNNDSSKASNLLVNLSIRAISIRLSREVGQIRIKKINKLNRIFTLRRRRFEFKPRLKPYLLGKLRDTFFIERKNALKILRKSYKRRKLRLIQPKIYKTRVYLHYIQKTRKRTKLLRRRKCYKFFNYTKQPALLRKKIYKFPKGYNPRRVVRRGYNQPRFYRQNKHSFLSYRPFKRKHTKESKPDYDYKAYNYITYDYENNYNNRSKSTLFKKNKFPRLGSNQRPRT